MDTQQLLKKSPTYKEDFKFLCKTLLKCYYVAMALIVISAILNLIASVQLQDITYAIIQLTIIISSSVLIPLVIGSVYAIIRKDNTIQVFNVCNYLVCFVSLIVSTCATVSCLLPLGSLFCGCFIQHDGYISGNMISSNLQYNAQCSNLGSQDGSKTDIVKGYAIVYLEEQCKNLSDKDSCLNLSSLNVYSWGSLFGFQLAACIVGTLSGWFLVGLLYAFKRKFTLYDMLAQSKQMMSVQQQRVFDNNQIYQAAATNNYIPQIPLNPSAQQNSDQQQQQNSVPQQLQQQQRFQQQQRYQYQQQPQMQQINPNNQQLNPQVNPVQPQQQNNNQQQLNLGAQNPAYF